MKPLAIVGVLLIVIGIAGLAIDNISFTERKTIVDAGPLKVTADEQRTVPIPTIAGVVSVVVPSQGEAHARYGVIGLTHSVGTPTDLIAITASGGLFSTTARIAENRVVWGMSSNQDLNSGGGNGVFTRPATIPMPNVTAVGSSRAMIIISPEVMDRMFYAYAADYYGATGRGDQPPVSSAIRGLILKLLKTHPNAWSLAYPPSYNAYNPAAAPAPAADDAAIDRFVAILRQYNAWNANNSAINLKRPVGRAWIEAVRQSAQGGSSESIFPQAIAVSDMLAYVVGSEQVRAQVIEGLKALGIDSINGKDLSAFVVVQPKLFPIEELPAYQDPPLDPLDFVVDGTPPDARKSSRG